jgi:hypothetical protein
MYTDPVTEERYVYIIGYDGSTPKVFRADWWDETWTEQDAGNHPTGGNSIVGAIFDGRFVTFTQGGVGFSPCVHKVFNFDCYTNTYGDSQQTVWSDSNENVSDDLFVFRSKGDVGDGYWYYYAWDYDPKKSYHQWRYGHDETTTGSGWNDDGNLSVGHDRARVDTRHVLLDPDGRMYLTYYVSGTVYSDMFVNDSLTSENTESISSSYFYWSGGQSENFLGTLVQETYPYKFVSTIGTSYSGSIKNIYAGQYTGGSTGYGWDSSPTSLSNYAYNWLAPPPAWDHDDTVYIFLVPYASNTTMKMNYSDDKGDTWTTNETWFTSDYTMDRLCCGYTGIPGYVVIATRRNNAIGVKCYPSCPSKDPVGPSGQGVYLF